MNEPLTKRFAAPDALGITSDALIRIGALYHLLRKVTTVETNNRLLELLGQVDPNNHDEESMLFGLHVAIGLSQRGKIEGINWILRFIQKSQNDPERRLGLTALRNCSQFPLAMILGNVVSPSDFETVYNNTRNIIELSDDEMWAMSEQKKQSDDREKTIKSIAAQLAKAKIYFSKNKTVNFGTVLTSPLFNAGGFRYSGFIGIELNESLIGVPYTMSEVINIDTGAARYSAIEMMRPGRHVLLAHHVEDHDEAAIAVYALPLFPPKFSLAEDLVQRMSFGCKGCEIAVIVNQYEKSLKKGDKSVIKKYSRMITANGNTWNYPSRPEDKLGLCSFIHSKNDNRPLRSKRFIIDDKSVQYVLDQFLEKNELEHATLLRQWHEPFEQHVLGCQSGDIIDRVGPFCGGTIILVEETENGKKYPISLPITLGTIDDKVTILNRFFNAQPAMLGVVVAIVNFVPIVVNFQTKERVFAHWEKSQLNLMPGILVFWDDRREKLHLGFLFDVNARTHCEYCYDSGYRVCQKCHGEKRVTCPRCHGAGEHLCEKCSGTGKIQGDCNRCGGTGTCGRCGGRGAVTLKCTPCNGTGRYPSGALHRKCGGTGEFDGECRVCSKSGKCPKCGGSGQFIRECSSCDSRHMWNCAQCRRSGCVECNYCDESRTNECSCGGSSNITLVPNKEWER